MVRGFWICAVYEKTWNYPTSITHGAKDLFSWKVTLTEDDLRGIKITKHLKRISKKKKWENSYLGILLSEQLERESEIILFKMFQDREIILVLCVHLEG